MDRHVFHDRRSAGALLGVEVAKAQSGGPVVLGLPRGGVPVAAEVAKAIDAPLDVIVVRKLGVPRQPELAMGAIGENGVVIVNRDVVRASRTSEHELADGRSSRACRTGPSPRRPAIGPSAPISRPSPCGHRRRRHRHGCHDPRRDSGRARLRRERMSPWLPPWLRWVSSRC